MNQDWKLYKCIGRNPFSDGKLKTIWSIKKKIVMKNTIENTEIDGGIFGCAWQIFIVFLFFGDFRELCLINYEYL